MGRPTKWREQFIADMAREGQSIETARAFLRVGATLQRLAEAQCNGDYPADNGSTSKRGTVCKMKRGESVGADCPCGSDTCKIENVPDASPCAQCESLWWPVGLRKDGRCLDCHATDRARKLQVERLPADWAIAFQGDPRGCIITLKTPQGREIGVP